MAVSRVEALALGAAALLAIAVPTWLLWPATPPAPSGMPDARALSAPTAPPLTLVYKRALFSEGATGEDNADAPQLIGIVGRIGSDAVAMVRSGERSRTLQVGESVDGWTLESLASDAAFFTRGGQRERVPMPSSEDPAGQ